MLIRNSKERIMRLALAALLGALGTANCSADPSQDEPPTGRVSAANNWRGQPRGSEYQDPAIQTAWRAAAAKYPDIGAIADYTIVAPEFDGGMTVYFYRRSQLNEDGSVTVGRMSTIIVKMEGDSVTAVMRAETSLE
jgi:hypothetical protein